MLNLAIILILGFMIYWYGSQGVFSALLHLFITILAGVIAFALWEPLVYGWLLNRMPDSAWGVGLLLPFGCALIALRVPFDQFITGNQDFHNMVQRGVGGFLGFLAGVLTCGMLVIGLQMTGISSLLGYSGWDLNEAGQPERTQKLLIPVDSVASGFFTFLSRGAFAPITGHARLGTYHPNIAIEASLFTQPAFEPSRKALRPDNVSLMSDKGYFALAGELPKSLAARIQQTPDVQTVIIGTDVQLQVQGRAGAADGDATFRVARRQIMLAYDDPYAPAGTTRTVFPVAYIQNGELKALALQGEYAYSAPSVADTKIHFVFQIPAKATPLYLNMKETRLMLPEKPAADVAAADGLIYYVNTVPVATNPNTNTNPTAGGSEEEPLLVVSDVLPFTINRNVLNSNNVTTDGDSVVAGRARIRKEKGRPGEGLAVNKIHHAESAKIVRANLGQQGDAKSLLGQIMQVATAKTQAPTIVDSDGKVYFAIGYAIVQPGGLILSINPNETLRALSQIEELGSASAEDKIVLYFQAPIGVSIARFDLGGAKSTRVDPPLKVE
ncbi:MAG: hypothetical protein GC162_04135 [Planctomycetes bacterium]|nr:hypothetical protein [Planctomycetota bacterium]